jgi:hypothetical protein
VGEVVADGLQEHISELGEVLFAELHGWRGRLVAQKMEH